MCLDRFATLLGLMDISSSYVTRCDNLKTDLLKLSQLISRLSSSGAAGLPSVGNSLMPRERAELAYALAYSVLTTYTALLRCQGTDASKHAVNREEDRMRSYLDKLTQNINPDSQVKQMLSKDVASRMVTHHLNSGNR